MEQFITSLYSLAEYCEYGEMKDEMIRDRIVVGIRDRALSEQLQLDAELTLEKAKKRVRQREAIQEQRVALNEGVKLHSDLLVDSVGSRKGKQTHRKVRNPPAQGKVTNNTKCTRCGKEPHARNSCPAIEAICHTCKKRGHYSSQCFRKISVGDVNITTPNEQSQEYYETLFLDTINSGQRNMWNVTIQVEGKDVRFKLDTGAEVTVVGEKVLNSLDSKKLQTPTKRLCGPDQTPLQVLGEIPVTPAYKNRSCCHPVFIVKNLQQNLLGLPAIQSLSLLTLIEMVNTPIPEQYPSLFNGLGTFPECYEIRLRQDTQPFSLFTPRSVPLPLRKKVEEELGRMESLNVISRVDEPTPWCAAMVVVPKRNSETVRICVDFRPLNECVLREVHPLPKVEETLAQLSGATVFSKVDANCGFWQIPLAKHSRPYTTFITPFGRYCFSKLPFGISSAPEHFQKQMNNILRGMAGVLCHMDDVLIFGSTQDEQDNRLHKVLQKLQSHGVTLNKQKCEFSRKRLTFLGHTIDENGISPDPQKTNAILKMEKPKSPTEMRRFLGMVSQLSKFTPNVASLTKPLQELLSSKKSWRWSHFQDEAFEKVKKELTKPSILALYNPDANTKICSDASSFGLGAVLLQQHRSKWRPVAYASRAMSDTEQRSSKLLSLTYRSVQAD